MYDHLTDVEFIQHYEYLFYKQEAFKRLEKYVDFEYLQEEVAALKEENEGLRYENKALSEEVCKLKMDGRYDN